MSQHDLNIANQGFPAFRADLNNALVALGTNASGATEPSTTFAHQFWMDTAADPSILKVRNADNDAWITLGTFNQTADTFTPAGVTLDKIEEGNSKVEVVDTGTGYIVFEVDGAEVARFNPDQLVTKAGTASTPAVSPTGDLNTGIFFPAADTIAFAEGGAEAMRIDSSGNVGIGTTSPQSTFQVGSVSAGTAESTNKGLVMIQSAPSTIDSAGGLEFKTSANGSGYGWKIAGINNVGDPLVFGNRGNSATFTERARIDSSGNLMVGTTTSLNGNTSYSFQNNSSTLNTMWIQNANTSDGTAKLVITSARAANAAFNFIDCGANWPTSFSRQFLVTGDGVIYAQNTNVQSASDIRIKENIRNSEDGLDVITALRPVRFDFKEGFGNDRKNQLGFIAQEIEPVFPDAVGEWDQDGETYKSVGPGALIPVLVKAIQELKAINDAQASRIETLEAKVAALESGS